MATMTPRRKAKPATARSSAKKPLTAPVRAARASARARQPTRSQRPSAAAPPVSPLSSGTASASKQARLIAVLQSEPGATIAQMMALTGWQAHTVRGAISGALRKRLGLNVVCNAPGADGARLYRIVAARAPA